MKENRKYWENTPKNTPKILQKYLKNTPKIHQKIPQKIPQKYPKNTPKNTLAFPKVNSNPKIPGNTKNTQKIPLK